MRNPRDITSFTIVPLPRQLLLLRPFYDTSKMLYLLILICLTCVSGKNILQPLFSWKQLDWNFPNEAMRNSYETSGRFLPANNLPVGINVWHDKMFLTVPRWRAGVPANLNYINLNETISSGDSSPRLTPYPSWEDNDINNDDALVNILRLRIDECDRMWAIDSGVDDIWGERRVVQPPKLIAIDLKTNKIIHRYRFKDSDLTTNSFFAENVVDVDKKNCSDAHVYMSDFGGYGLVVYSLAKNDSWRIQHNYFYFEPLNGHYSSNGIHFSWSDGLFGLALSPPIANGSRTLYFHAMSSTTEFSVPTDLIKDQQRLDQPDYYLGFRVVGNKGRNSQGTSMRFDPVTGIIYFTQINKDALACWDTHMQLNPHTFQIIAQDNKTMIFPNDLAIDLTTRRLYLTTDDLATMQFSRMDLNRTNFYVHVASLDELAKECREKCRWEMSPGKRHRPHNHSGMHHTHTMY